MILFASLGIELCNTDLLPPVYIPLCEMVVHSAAAKVSLGVVAEELEATAFEVRRGTRRKRVTSLFNARLSSVGHLSAQSCP